MKFRIFQYFLRAKIRIFQYFWRPKIRIFQKMVRAERLDETSQNLAETPESSYKFTSKRRQAGGEKA